MVMHPHCTRSDFDFNKCIRCNDVKCDFWQKIGIMVLKTMANARAEIAADNAKEERRKELQTKWRGKLKLFEDDATLDEIKIDQLSREGL
jgi:hypothetical protein